MFPFFVKFYFLYVRSMNLLALKLLNEAVLKAIKFNYETSSMNNCGHYCLWNGIKNVKIAFTQRIFYYINQQSINQWYSWLVASHSKIGIPMNIAAISSTQKCNYKKSIRSIYLWKSYIKTWVDWILFSLSTHRYVLSVSSSLLVHLWAWYYVGVFDRTC